MLFAGRRLAIKNLLTGRIVSLGGKKLERVTADLYLD